MHKHSRYRETAWGATRRSRSARVVPSGRVYSIGHSNQTLAELLALLHSKAIQLLVDCRTTPYSSHSPQFNREELATALAEAGITYTYAGTELGGQTDDRPAGRAVPADYDQMARRPIFRRALDQVAAAAQDQAVCLLCSEEDARRCHRSHLLARELLAAGVDVHHIRRDGAEELQSELEREAARHRQLLLFPPTGREDADAG